MGPITFFVPGEPAAQGRPRARVMRIGRRFAPQIYNPHNAEDWKARVSITARPFAPKAPMLGPIRVHMTFMLPRPQSHYVRSKERALLKPSAPLWHTSKPDFDNFAKALIDALTGIRMWADDSQVCDSRVLKIYSVDKKPGCLVTLEKITSEPLHELCLTFPADSQNLSENILKSPLPKAPVTND
jgi:Holliday junction resolvase RusA-like endonuclease